MTGPETKGPDAAEPAPSPRATRLLTIVNRKGLHARASAKFADCAGRFDASITVTRDGITVAATSIMGLMALTAGMGSDILIEAAGADAEAALAALAELVEAGFYEEK